MSLTAVLWTLGGWFVLAVVASLTIGRMIYRASRADVPGAVETPAQAGRPADQVARPSLAA